MQTFKNLHLLYVEDDVQIRHEISEFLRRYFGLLYEVSSAEEALEYYTQKKPDIILLDINLPGKNGLHFASEVRQEDKQTRIIVSTAYTDQAFLLRAIELDLTRYLVKPLTGKNLLEALTKATEEIESNRDNVPIIDLGESFFYDSQKKLLFKDNEEIPLRRKEMQLLEFFIHHPKETIEYATLEYMVWKDEPMSRDAIRAQIKNLRKKTHPNIIKNINSIGYRLFSNGL